MAKRQVRKHGRNNPSRLEPRKLFQKLMEEADDRAKLPETHEKILYLPDHTWLKEKESKLSKSGRMLLHFLLYGQFGQIDPNNTDLFRPSVYIMNTCGTPVKHMIEMVCAQMLTEMITPEKTSAELDLGDVIKRLADLEHKMPDEFHDDDIINQQWKHARANFADITTTGLFDMLNWDVITDGTDYTKFAINIMHLVDTVITEEQLLPFVEKRTEIIQHTIQQLIKQIPSAIDKGNQHLAEEGYIKAPQVQPVNPLLMNPNIKPKFPDFPCVPLIPSLFTTQVTEDMIDADPWFIAFSGLLHTSNMAFGSEFRSETASKFTLGELAFTVFSLLQNSAETNVFSCIMEILLTELLLTRSSNEAVQNLLKMPDAENTYWEYDTFAPVAFSEDMKKTIQQHKDHDRYIMPKGYDLMNLILLYDNVVPHRLIRIHNKVMPILQHMGYGEKDAAALCGYIEGLKAQAKHAAATSIFIHFHEQERDADEEDDAEAETTEQKISELTAKLENVQQQVSTEMEEVKRKHSKEKKALQHHVLQTEDKLRTLITENDELRERIRALENERNQLKNTVVEFSLQNKEQTDLTQQDEESTIQYPSSIGENLKILCFGGSDNWVATQHRRFPNIEFHGYGDTMNPSSVTDADIILVNTFVLKHAMYWPLKNEADRVGKQMFSFPARGINSGSNYIVSVYNDYIKRHPEKE